MQWARSSRGSAKVAEKDSHFGQFSGLEHVVGGGPRVFVNFLFHIRKEQPFVRLWTTKKTYIGTVYAGKYPTFIQYNIIQVEI